MPTQSDIAARIIASLRLTDPELDTSVGSLGRKIIDSVASPIADLTTESHLINYQYDIDSKSGGALDDFVRLFGIERVKAQRATGVVTFSRPAKLAANRTAAIPMGTHLVSSGLESVVVQTIARAVMSRDQTSVDVPVQALANGPIGNLPGGSITGIAATLDGVTAVVNHQPLTGGVAQQNDADLRAQFKQTVFKNLAGTEHMYRAMALQFTADPTDTDARPVTRVNVVGPTLTWTEQLAITSGAASSTITDAVHIYPSSIFVTAEDGTVLANGPDYTASVVPATAGADGTARVKVSLSGLDGVDTTLYDLQFTYVSSYSRNDPAGDRFTTGVSVNNRIDIWTNGTVNRVASQSPKFVTSSQMQFVNSPGDPMHYQRFATPDGIHPAVGDVFVPLGFGPIVAVPDTLTVGSAHYTRGVNYDIVHQSDAFGFTASGKHGLVWHTGTSWPASNTVLPTIRYTYNAVPGLLERRLDTSWRLLGTDARVHAGIAKAFKFHFAIVFLPRFSAISVEAAIEQALQSFVNTLGFNSALQVSDVLQVVHNVPGVDNVRFLTNADDINEFGIQRMLSTGAPDSGYSPPYGVYATSGGRAKDVYFDDASYPVYGGLRVIQKAKNTFGAS